MPSFGNYQELAWQCLLKLFYKNSLKGFRENLFIVVYYKHLMFRYVLMYMYKILCTDYICNIKPWYPLSNFMQKRNPKTYCEGTFFVNVFLFGRWPYFGHWLFFWTMAIFWPIADFCLFSSSICQLHLCFFVPPELGNAFSWLSLSSI